MPAPSKPPSSRPRGKQSPARPEPVANHRTAAGEKRKAQTRARIVRAAALVFAERGADGPVIEDFIQAAGVARGTFYNHFATTGELLEATIKTLAAELTLAIVDALATVTDPVERAACGMRLYLDWITADPARCAFFGRIPEVSETARADARRRLVLGKASGHFKFDQLDAACDMSFGALSETIRRLAKNPGAPRRSHDVVAIVLVGIGVPPDRIREVLAQPLPQLRLPNASS